MRPIIVMLLSLVVIAACGGGEDAKTPSNPIESLIEDSEEWPACDEVWVVGQKLPEDYKGCQSTEGIVPADPYWECADGTRLTYVDKPAAFARIGGEIKAGNNQTAAFRAELEKCEPA